MARIDSFLELAVKQNASDLHLMSGEAPRIRLHGELFPIKYRALSITEADQLLTEIMPAETREAFATRCGVDFAYDAQELSRFRVSVFRHLGGVGAVFRTVPSSVPDLGDLGMPPVLGDLSKRKKGLLLVVGPTGSGKSTTLAAMIHQINVSRKAHIITIEDPVEFLHPRRNSLISQREVGVHTQSFAIALRAALREDPNVVLVGEMRDLETVSMAVGAAETGMLVLATLHTNGAGATVDRIVNLFPGKEQARIRSMLSTSLCGVVAQQLVKRVDGKGRAPAVEILINNAAAGNLIREGKAKQLQTVMQTGALVGMQTMDQSLQKLLNANQISGAEAYARAQNKQMFEKFRDAEKLAYG